MHIGSFFFKLPLYLLHIYMANITADLMETRVILKMNFCTNMQKGKSRKVVLTLLVDINSICIASRSNCFHACLEEFFISHAASDQ